MCDGRGWRNRKGDKNGVGEIHIFEIVLTGTIKFNEIFRLKMINKTVYV